MAGWTKVGEIALWKNKKKQGKQPDVTGKLKMDDGTELSVSLWKQDLSENPNRPVYSGFINKEDGAEAERPAPTQTQNFDDGIPF